MFESFELYENSSHTVTTARGREIPAVEKRPIIDEADIYDRKILITMNDVGIVRHRHLQKSFFLS